MRGLVAVIGLGLDDEVALRDLDDRRRLLARVQARLASVGLRALRAAEHRLGLAVDAVEETGRRVVGLIGRLELRRAGDGLIEGLGAGTGLTGARTARDARIRRVRLAVGTDDRGLPVIEPQDGRRADLLLGLIRVADIWQGHVDLVTARTLNFGLRDAEAVDALAHDVHRALDGIGRDLAELRRLGLVDERRPAFEIKALARLLRQRRSRDDHRQRKDEQDADEGEDDEISATVCHAERTAAYCAGTGLTRRTTCPASGSAACLHRHRTRGTGPRSPERADLPPH